MASKGKKIPIPNSKRGSSTELPAPAAQQPKRKVPNASPAGSGFLARNIFPVVLLLAISFGLYYPSLSYGYVLDDGQVIEENSFVQKGFAGLVDIFSYDSFMGRYKEQKHLLEGGRYRPLSLATFAIENSFFGKDRPGASHFINILLYGLTGIFLYRILLMLFPVRESGRWWFSMPFMAALLFIVHPLHVEVVANIKGRDEILALIGSLGALYATLKYQEDERKKWLYYSGISMFLGLLAKENALTFLAVVPVSLIFFTKAPTSRIITATIPLFIASLLFIFIRYRALGFMVDHGQSVSDLMNNPFVGMNSGEKFATIFLTLGWYVKLLFVPHPLTHDYYPYQVPKVNWSEWKALASLGLYVAIGLYGAFQLYRARKNSGLETTQTQKIFGWSILYYLLTISIVSNLFIGVGTFMNERFLYMPSVAFCLLIAQFITRQLPSWLKQQTDAPSLAGLIILLPVLALASVRIWTRLPDWKDDDVLNASSLKVSPNSCRSNCFHSEALFKEYTKTKDPAAKAALVDSMEYYLNRSLSIYPDYSAALLMKTPIASARYDLDKNLEKLFQEWAIVLERMPNNPKARKFIGDFMKRKQGHVDPGIYLAFCHRIGYELYFLKKQDKDSAVEFLQYGFGAQPDDPQMLDDLAKVYEASGDSAKAEEMKQRIKSLKGR